MSYIEYYNTKEKSGVGWLLAQVWKLRGNGKKLDKGRWPLCLGIEAIKNVLLRCSENR
jgi:hypothetical protein